MGQTIELRTGERAIRAYRAEPHTAARGAIVVVQEIFGVNSHIRAMVDRFADHGFVAIAPCLFDHVAPGTELGYDEDGVHRGRELVKELGFDRAVADVGAAAKSLDDAHKVGVVGFCWGGTVAFLANARLGLPAVTYYGGRSVPFLHERARAPMMFHFGEHDPIIPPEHVQWHRAAQPDAEIHLYPAGHGCNCDQRADYHEDSARLAMERTLVFFERHLA